MLAEINKRIVTMITARHQEFRDVGRHRGRMTPEDVKTAGAFAPAARVGLFGRLRSEREPSGQVCVRVPFAIAIIAAEGDLIDSQDRAIALAVAVQNSVAGFIPGAADAELDWPALQGVGLPEDIELDISDADWLDDEGIALWAVLFTVSIDLGDSFAAIEAAELTEISFREGFELGEVLP